MHKNLKRGPGCKVGVFMRSASYKPGRTFMSKFEHGSELVGSVLDFATNQKITRAFFTIIGAVKRAKLGYYDQKRHKYIEVTLEQPLEIVSCIGNISLKDGKPFVHAHAVLADRKGQTKAGHLLEATVFAAELQMQELIGPELVRVHDEVTGLSLWKL